MTAKPRTPPHVFTADPDLLPHPADLERRAVCLTCRLLGEPGDPHHTMPDPGGPDVQQLRAGDTGGEG